MPENSNREMLVEVTCRCGWTTRGSEAGVIRDITLHAKTEHGLDLSPADVRAIWHRVEDRPDAR